MSNPPYISQGAGQLKFADQEIIDALLLLISDDHAWKVKATAIEGRIVCSSLKVELFVLLLVFILIFNNYMYYKTSCY